MSPTLLLGLGGPWYDPDDPYWFHPALHAAGHLLRAAEAAISKIPKEFARHLIQPDLIQRPRTEVLVGIRDWSDKHHLASPDVLELLYLTYQVWFVARWRQALRRAESTALPPDLLDQPVDEEDRCDKALAGWGPWVELLTEGPAEGPIRTLLELGAPIHHLARPRRSRRSESLVVEAPAWNPETENWREAEARLRLDFEARLQRHRTKTEGMISDRGFLKVPTMTAKHHFKWLIQRQLTGARPSTIARAAGVGVSTVHAALSRLTDFLELPLRPVKSGPEPW